MVERRRCVLAFSALLFVVAAGCHRAVMVTPSLGPMDNSQSMVRYKPIQGSACESWILYLVPTGGDLLLEAVWDLERLANVDGYMEVTVEEHTTWWLLGYTTCVTVTAYPFTYGTEPKPLQLKRPMAGASLPPSIGGPPVVAAPPPAAASPPPSTNPPPRPMGPAAVECDAACDRLGRLAGSTQTIQDVIAGKCRERCYGGDQVYYSCVLGARVAEDVRRCNNLP